MKRLYFFALILLTLVFAVSGTMAAGSWYREDRTTNIISVADLSGELIDVYEQGTVLMPGDRAEKTVAVKNTGSSDALVRVSLKESWDGVPGGDCISGESAGPGNLVDGAGGLIEYGFDTDNWAYDAGTGHFYYLGVLHPGETTPPLMKSFCLNGPLVNNTFSGKGGSIIVIMEMVQAAAGGISIWEKTNGELGVDYAERPYDGGDHAGVHFTGNEGGFTFGSGGDLFSSFKRLLPGQVLVQNINVGSGHGRATEIFLRAEPAGHDDDPEHVRALIEELLTEYINVTVRSGGRIVYKGPVWNVKGASADNSGLLRAAPADGLYGNGISLGAFESGDGKPVTVELEFSKDAGNEFSNLAGKVHWIFSAGGTDAEPAPQTGDNDVSVFLIIMLASGACMAVIAAVARLKKTNGRKRAGRASSGLTAVFAAAGIAIALTSAGMTAAFMTDRETASNTVVAGRLDIDVEEPGFEPGRVVRAGEIITKDPRAVNNGTVPALAYISVRVPVKNVRTVHSEGKYIIPAAEHELFSFTPEDSWMLLERNGVNGSDGKYIEYTYGYCGGVLAPGEKSAPLFESVTFLNILEGELQAGSYVNIEVCARGIQSAHLFEDSDLPERLRRGFDEFLKEATQ